MTISGGIKFMRKSYADIDLENVTVSMSSGSTSRDNMRSRNRISRTESLGSNDTTTETWVITFEDSYAINRVILGKHNFKEFTVKYWNGSAWTAFSTPIAETVNAQTLGSYYEFDSVTTDQIQIAIAKTQTANENKYLYALAVTEEIGTLQGYPVHQFSMERDQVVNKVLSGRAKTTIFGDGYHGKINFDRHPTAADHAVIMALWDAQQEFIVYPCGGNATQYRFPTAIGNRLMDFYLVAMGASFDPNYTQNCYALGLNYSVDLMEVA